MAVARPRAQKHKNVSSDTAAGVGARVKRTVPEVEVAAACSLGELVVDDADEP